MLIKIGNIEDEIINLHINVIKTNIEKLKELFPNIVSDGKINFEMLRILLNDEIDDSNEKIGYKIREAQLEKIPYMFILGDKEFEEGTVSVRSRKEGDLGAMTIEQITEKLVEEDRSKRV